MNCAICWDAMDMKEFNDERDGTETSFKLDCGHAFHTKCIVLALQKTKHSCPSCNKEKEPRQELEITGLAKKLFTEALRDPEINELKKEMYASLTSYKELLNEHKKKCREEIYKLTEEMKIKENRDYFLKTLSVLKTRVKHKVSEMGPAYIGASLYKKEQWDLPLIERLMLPEHCRIRFRMYRLKKPWVYSSIFNPKKDKHEVVTSDSDRNDGDDVHTFLQSDN
jgi:hypothetical protein